MYWVFILLFLNNHALAKDRRGDPFRTSYESTFLRSGSIQHLNSLHVVASPLAEEPFSLSNLKVSFDHINDNVNNLLAPFSPYSKVSKIHELDQLELTSGETLKSVWSYHAFPVARGGLGRRYGDRSDLSWVELFQEFLSNPPEDLIKENRIAELSPLEKYELLTGINFSLSRAEWLMGQRYQDEFHEVPTWIGICHGTAPASFTHPRPQKSITMRAPDSTPIIFYPSDIKALLSFAWSKSGGATAVMGRRCSEMILPGVRPTSSCQDTNPASLHLAITNLIGVQGRPVIVDTSAGPEVWNRTIISYKYRYFRPGPRNITDNLARAIVKRDMVVKDPFLQFRSKDSTHLVGVEMELTYVIGTEANSNTNNSPAHDQFDTMVLNYDLELTANGEIIGGEWLQHTHPDFLWVVSNDYRPLTIQDHLIGTRLNNIDGKVPLVVDVLQHAQGAAENGEILFSLIDRMLQISH